MLDNQGRPTGFVKAETIQQALRSLPRPRPDKVDKRQQIPPALNQKSRHLPESLIIETVLNRTLETGIVGVDENLELVYFNPAAREFLKNDATLILGSNIQTIGKDKSRSKRSFKEALSETIRKNEQSFSIETTGEDEGKSIQCRLSLIENGPDRLGYVIALHDVTVQKKEKQAIRRLAYYDSLTKLPNRLLFYERMFHEIKRVKRKHGKMALAMMDLDGFKNINDQYGHLAGDKLLRTVSKRLAKAIRESDTVARFGGDEFTFIFPEIKSIQDAETLTNKLRQAIRKPVKIGSGKIRISASIGIAIFPDDGKTLKSLLKAADTKMYLEKTLVNMNKVARTDGG